MSHSLSKPAGVTTLVDVLRARALETPDGVAYRFLRDGEVEDAPLTYAALDEQARAIATWLQEAGMAGGRALLLHPPGLEFVAAFLGCLYAGVVAVPAYPPRPHRPDPRIREITADSGPKLALTTAAVLAATEGRPTGAPGLDGFRGLATDTVSLDLAARWQEPPLRGDDLAYLQYTSGSTRTPKGVMISHANVLHNTAQLDRMARPTPESVGMSWLPHFHDMGLIYGIVLPLYAGFPGVLMPPAAFLQRPLRWLRCVSDCRATFSGGPNFAYELCTSRIGPEQKDGLDLSRWRIAFSGAEPVRQETLDRFAEAFAPCGFRREALAAGYGLAEATLMVTLSRPGAPPASYRAAAAELERNRLVPATTAEGGARTLVGCGSPGEISPATIVDPETRRPCAAGEVGEIWVSGPSVAQGYWNRPEESALTFGARLDDGRGPFLRTGDLGAVAGDELFVTGRRKELVIIRGLNHYPQDLEQTIQASHAALRPGAGATFSVDAVGGEGLVIVQEVERTQRSADPAELVQAIRRAVTEEHEIEPHAIVLLRPGSILKTSSGKIQRGACRTAFLDGTLSALHEWRRPAGEETAPESPEAAAAAAAHAPGPRSEDDIAIWLVSRLACESRIDPDEIDVGQPFASFGIDSARALLLVGDLETWLGRRVPPITLWNYPTVAALARHLAG